MNGETGFIYAATGKKHVREAEVSATRLLKVMPDANVVLFTDDISLMSDVFHNILQLEDAKGHCSDKIEAITKSPFKKSIFLDTDTYICEELSDVFFMLDKYDFAMAQSPYRYPYESCAVDAFPELNSGVMAWRSNELTKKCLVEWQEILEKQKKDSFADAQDQHALRDALYLSDATLWVLPPEYNFRSDYPGFIGKGSRVKIIHGREVDIADVHDRLNVSNENRITLACLESLTKENLIFINGSKVVNCFYSLVRGLQFFVRVFRK